MLTPSAPGSYEEMAPGASRNGSTTPLSIMRNTLTHTSVISRLVIVPKTIKILQKGLVYGIVYRIMPREKAHFFI